jgi:hypothetical protein
VYFVILYVEPQMEYTNRRLNHRMVINCHSVLVSGFRVVLASSIVPYNVSDGFRTFEDVSGSVVF